MTTTEHLFDAGTAVEARGRGRYQAKVADEWWVDRGPNGGYLASIVLRALTLEVNDELRTPRSLTVHYVARPTAGEVEVETSLERFGRSTTATTARLQQGGTLLATAQATFSIARSGPSFDDSPRPSVPPPEEIPEIPAPRDMLPRFAWNFDYRWALGGIPFTGSDHAISGGWIRPNEPRPIDTLLLTTYADGWTPAIFTKLSAPSPVPTIDLTVHFRGTGEALPADWALVRFETKVASAGYIEEDGYIWSRNGDLLAQSRQLALYQDPR